MTNQLIEISFDDKSLEIDNIYICVCVCVLVLLYFLEYKCQVKVCAPLNNIKMLKKR